MARPPDPARRARTLAKATDYLTEHGLAGLSLRPLAAALGTSTRMLLYDFGGKERLIAEALAEARRRTAATLAEHLAAEARAAPGELLHALWDWLTAPERRPYLRLFFEAYVDALARPGAYPNGAAGLVTDWLDALAVAFRPPGHDRLDPAGTTLVIAVLRGLLLDRMATGDAERTDRALARFAASLAG